MPSLQSHHGTQKKTHTSMLLFWSMSNPMSMILFNFLGSVCNFGCIFCLCMSMRLSFPVYSILLFSLRMVSVWLVVNYDSVTSVVNDYWASWWLWCRWARVLGSVSCQSVSWPPCCCYCQLVVQVNNGPGLGGCISYQHPCLFRALLPDWQIPGAPFAFPLLSALLLS